MFVAVLTGQCTHREAAQRCDYQHARLRSTHQQNLIDIVILEPGKDFGCLLVAVAQTARERCLRDDVLKSVRKRQVLSPPAVVKPTKHEALVDSCAS